MMLHKIKQMVERKLRIPPRIASGPKPTLFVHGGSGKTGTTAIQKFLGENYKKLHRIGIQYPIINTNIPVTIYPWAGNAGALYLSMLTQEALNGLAIKIRRSIKHGISKVLLSGEILSNVDEQNVTKFMSAFAPHFDIEVIFFLRDPLLWSYSAWKQIVRSVPERCTFEQFLETRKLQEILSPRGWFAPARKVHLFSYDEHKTDLISTFFSAMDIDIKRSFPDADSVSANPSLNSDEVDFLRLLHSIPEFAKDMRISQKIANEFTHMPNRKPDGKPDPRLADLAIRNQEPMFAVTDRYLPRDRIIKTVASGAPWECTPADAWIDPEHVRIALEVLAKHYSSKDAS